MYPNIAGIGAHYDRNRLINYVNFTPHETMNGDVVLNSIHYEDKAGHVIDRVGRTFTTDSSETVIYGTITGKIQSSYTVRVEDIGKTRGRVVINIGHQRITTATHPNEPNVP